jgi:hypothetical protein
MHRPQPRGYSIPFIDLAGETHRQVLVDQIPGVYLGQPDTVLLADNHTILLAYPHGHGGHSKTPQTYLKRSDDGGRTWSNRLPTPPSFKAKHNAPVLHRVTDAKGKERILLITSWPRMKQSVSKDNGKTWSPLAPIFPDSMKGKPGDCGYAPPKSVMAVAGGRHIALYHDLLRERPRRIEIVQIESLDGGLTWGTPRIVSRHPKFPEAHPCEPCLIRSPDGKQILCLARENKRKHNSLVMVSNDDGKTWSEMVELPGALTGDRHLARYTSDGRLLVVFRDMAHDTPTRGDFVAWVGTYEDILAGRQGQYRVRLLDNHGRPGDTGYSGLERLHDGTFVATTYCVLKKGEQPCIVSVRFTVDDLDRRKP